MSSEEDDRPAQDGKSTRRLTDPKAMRAMAHPVRMALLELIAVAGTVTATQASEVLGESPANCAFHLRTLAKYGFVEEAGGGRGRERPWRSANDTISLAPGGMDDPQARLAVETLGNMWVDRWMARMRRVFANQLWPEEWEDAAHASTGITFLTSEEAQQVWREIMQVIDRYQHRVKDPASRPPGTLPVEFGVFTYPLADMTVLAGTEKPQDGGKQHRDIS